jgi:hypothetical protein
MNRGTPIIAGGACSTADAFFPVRPVSGILKDYRITGEPLFQKSENQLSEFPDYRKTASFSAF